MYRVYISGDGNMEWEEFTAFCIEAGMAADSNEQAAHRRFTEHENFNSQTAHSIFVSHVRYFAELDVVVSTFHGTAFHPTGIRNAD